LENTCEACGSPFETRRRSRRFCPGYSCSNSAIATAREEKKLAGAATTVWSCGGGVQSTAIAVLIVQGKLPKPDYAVMTDVSHEKQATWDYVQKHLRPRLEEAGVRLDIVPTRDYVDTSLLDPGGYVRIPAYKRGEGGEVIKLRTHCSGLWKSTVTRRWMREQGIRKAVNWIGISADEAQRVRTSDLKWVELRYPLVDLGIKREDCLWLISSAEWPRPPRTSCHLCPLQDDSSWLKTKLQYPEDWAIAVAAEKALQQDNPNVYLHRSLVPLEEVEFSMSSKQMVTECETPGVQCWG